MDFEFESYMTGSSVPKSNCSLKSGLPCVLSSAKPLYPRKCGEFSFDMASFFSSGRSNSGGMRLEREVIMSSDTP